MAPKDMVPRARTRPIGGSKVMIDRASSATPAVPVTISASLRDTSYRPAVIVLAAPRLLGRDAGAEPGSDDGAETIPDTAGAGHAADACDTPSDTRPASTGEKNTREASMSSDDAEGTASACAAWRFSVTLTAACDRSCRDTALPGTPESALAPAPAAAAPWAPPTTPIAVPGTDCCADRLPLAGMGAPAVTGRPAAAVLVPTSTDVEDPMRRRMKEKAPLPDDADAWGAAALPPSAGVGGDVRSSMPTVEAR